MESIPNLQAEDQELYSIPGSPPDLVKPPVGCPFAPRCNKCLKVCKQYPPQTHSFSDNHKATCWLYDERVKGAK